MHSSISVHHRVSSRSGGVCTLAVWTVGARRVWTVAARMLLVIVAGLLCACSSTLVPGRQSLAMHDVSFPMQDLRFPSGLRVVVEQDNRAPLVGIFVVVGAGSSSDPPGEEGLAHYIEHLTFRSRPYGKSTFLRLLERAGAGAWNAMTGLDYTAYFEVGPAAALPELLRLEGARMLAPVAKVSPDVLAVEREVVRNELRQRNETGFVGEVLGSLQAAVFPAGHPYARPVIGTHESLSEIAAEDIDGFLRRHYRPDNMTMVIVGDINLQTVGKLVQTSLPPELLAAPSPVKVGRRMPERASIPPMPPPGSMVRKVATVAAPELWIGWSLPRSFDTDAYLAEFIRRAASEELRGAARIDQDIAGVGTMLVDGKEASMLLCRVFLHRGSHPERSMGYVLNQLHQMWEPPSDSTAQQVRDITFMQKKSGAVVGMMLDAENMVDRGLSRAVLTHFAQDPTLYSRSLRAIGTLERDRVVEYAYRYLTRERARSVLFLPPAGGPGAAGATGVATPLNEEDNAPISVDAARIEAIARPLGVRNYREFRLDNGLEVIVGMHGGLPVVNVGLLLYGGEAAAESPAAARTAAWIAIPREKWHGGPEEFGGRFGKQLDRDAAYYWMQGASGNAGIMLGILAERVRSMDVDSGALPYFQEHFVPFVGATEQKPEVMAERMFFATLYDSHPYARYASAKDMEDVSVGEAQSWLAKTHTPSNAVLAVVGDVNPDEVEQMVREQFGSWDNNGQAPGAPRAPSVPKGKPVVPQILVMPRPGATQAQMQLGCLLPSTQGRSTAGYDVAARLVQDRMHTMMRQRFGATYGIGAEVQVLGGGAAHLRIRGAVQTAKLTQALEALRDSLKSLAGEAVDPQELAWAKLRVAQHYSVAHMTTEDIVEALLDAKNAGRNITTIDEYPADLAKVSADAVRDTFARCASGHPTLSVLGDESAAREATEAVW